MRRWLGHARAVLPAYVFTNRDHGSKKDDMHGFTVIALVIASEQAVGALHGFDFALFWIPSTCCLDSLLLPLGLTILDCIFFSYLFGWVFEIIERSWTRTRQQERGFVYTSLSHRHDNGKRSTHQFLFPQDIPDGIHLTTWIYWLADLGSSSSQVQSHVQTRLDGFPTDRTLGRPLQSGGSSRFTGMAFIIPRDCILQTNIQLHFSSARQHPS